MSINYLKFKRFFDLILYLMLLILLSPLIIFIITILFIFNGRPIFYIQKRSGFNKKHFTLFKFRTMLTNENLNFNLRINKIGSFLRKYKIDEIPQLLNILIGDMSFVGPRPLLIEYDDLYTKLQDNRFKLTPGITGISQIKVFNKNNHNWAMKINYDLIYLKKISLRFDLYIMIQTLILLIKIILNNSAYKDNFDRFKPK